MDWVFELVCGGEPGRGEEARAWARTAARVWMGLPGLTALDIYSPLPDGAHDPFNNDGAGPLFIAMLSFDAQDRLVRQIESADFALSLGGRPAGLNWTGSAFERRFYSVAGETAPGVFTAPFSYVVRYHKPAEDEAAFIANYVATHPPTLATLPGIRAVMCYFPFDTMTLGVQKADYIIGNEVAFDDVAAFNSAMQSPVRQELRRHFHEFPPFSGLNTHFPMNRERLLG